MIKKNVMKIAEFDDSIYYRASCDCGHPDCDLELSVEKEKDIEHMYYLIITGTLKCSAAFSDDDKWYKNFFIRIKYILKILFFGYIETSSDFIMKKEQLDAFEEVIKEARNKFSL